MLLISCIVWLQPASLFPLFFASSAVASALSPNTHLITRSWDSYHKGGNTKTTMALYDMRDVPGSWNLLDDEALDNITISREDHSLVRKNQLDLSMTAGASVVPVCRQCWGFNLIVLLPAMLLQLQNPHLCALLESIATSAVIV